MHRSRSNDGTVLLPNRILNLNSDRSPDCISCIVGRWQLYIGGNLRHNFVCCHTARSGISSAR